MNVELIDFYRPDTNRKNLFITGIPQSLQENDIVVSVRFVRTQVKVRKKIGKIFYSFNSMFFGHNYKRLWPEPRMYTTWIGNCYRFASNCFPMIAASKYR